MSVTKLPPATEDLTGDQDNSVDDRDGPPSSLDGAASSLPVRRALRPATATEPYLPSPEIGRGKETVAEKVQATRLTRRLWLGVLAFVVAGVGEYLLFQEQLRLIAMALLIGAAVLGVIALGNVGVANQAATIALKGKAWWRVAWRSSLILRLFGIAASASLTFDSILVYRRDPSAIFGLQGVLWLCSIALLLISCAGWYSPPSGDSQSTSLPLSPRIRSSSPLWTRLEIVVFVGIVALSLLTHLAFLQQIPWRMHFDEGFAYTEVMRYYQGPAIPLFTTTWVGTSLPSMFFGIEGLLMHITGPDLAGVRLGVALAGALTVIPVYGLGRLLAGRKGAALAAFAVAVSAVYVHYSRVSILNVTTPLAWAVCFYFLVKGLGSRRPSDFVMSGLAAGLSMYTYYGTRLLPYLLSAFILYMLLFHFKAAREHLGHFALVALGFVAGFGPLIGYFTLNPDMWVSRGISQLNVPDTLPTTWDAIASDWNTLSPLLWQDFLGLGTIPGRDTVYFAPFLLPLEAALLLLGLGIVVWRWRQPAFFLVLLWIMGVILTGGILLDASTIPNFAHWTPAFPAFFLAIALPLALWWDLLVKVPSQWVRVVGSLVIVALLALDLGANAYFYLVQYPPLVLADHSIEAAQGRFVEAVPANTHVRVVGNTWAWGPLLPNIDQMMASPGSYVTRFFDPSRELPGVDVLTQNLAFLFYNDMYDYLPLMQGYFPGGIAGDVRSPDDTLIAKSYFVPDTLAATRYGVQASFTPAGAASPQWSGQLPLAGSLPGGIKLTYPLIATWSGEFYLDVNLPIKLSVQGLNGGTLWVEGEPASLGASLSVEPGWVPFSVSAQLAGPRTGRLFLQEGDAAPVEVDTSHLWPAPLNQGLAATMRGSTIAHRIDSFIGAGSGWGQSTLSTDSTRDPEGLSLFGALGDTRQIRWEGDVNTTSGDYTMEIRSDASFRLAIDGQDVVKACAAPGGHQTVDGGVHLAAGWHHVQIDYSPGGPTNGLEWFWVRPDGVREVVPPSALRISASVTPPKAIGWPVLPAPTFCQ